MTKKTVLAIATLFCVPIFSVAYIARTSDDAIAPTSEIKEAQPTANAPTAKASAEVPAEVEADLDPEGPNTGALTFEAGVDWVSSYIFRGYNQEDVGIIIQPYASIGINIADTDDLTIDASIGTWNSLHSEQTGGDDIWYESDVTAQIDFTFSSFTVSGMYFLYVSPNNAFEAIQEFGVQVAYDDSSLWNDESHGFALNPWVGVYKETSDGNDTQDSYAEIGIEPTWNISLEDRGWEGGDLSIAFPVKLGMSLDDFYTDSEGDNAFFGYVSGGVVATLPLPVSSRYGEWSLIGSVEYIQMLADSVEADNDGGTEYEVSGRVGIAFSY